MIRPINFKKSSINTTSCDTQLFWNAAIVSREVDHLKCGIITSCRYSTGPACRQQWCTVLTESRIITKLSLTVHLLHSRNSARLWANVFLLFSTNLQNKFRSSDKESYTERLIQHLRSRSPGVQSSASKSHSVVLSRGLIPCGSFLAIPFSTQVEFLVIESKKFLSGFLKLPPLTFYKGRRGVRWSHSDLSSPQQSRQNKAGRSVRTQDLLAFMQR